MRYADCEGFTTAHEGGAGGCAGGVNLEVGEA